MQEDPGADAVKAMWATSTAIQDFEHGRIEADAFAEAFVAEWSLRIPADAFLPIFFTTMGLGLGVGHLGNELED